MQAVDPRTVDLPPGPGWCREWTTRVDGALTAWLNDLYTTGTRRRGGIALVALGSYARRALCPRSDIDLLLLHDGWSAGDLERLVHAICYPLWDAGLSVGHAVRTPKQAVSAATERIDSATALTDRRLVVGDAGLADDLSARVARWLGRSGDKVLADLADADDQRRARYGNTPGALEPELKDGVGGLRDLHSLRWAAACVLGEIGLDPLVGARYLGASDRRELAAAGATLQRVRCALHLAIGGTGGTSHNRLRLELQDDVAQLLDLPDGDALLREVGLATRAVAHLHGRTWPLLVADAKRGRRRRRAPPEPVDEGVVLVDGLVETAETASLATDPSLGLRAVAAAGAHGTVLGRATARRLAPQVAQADSLPWDARVRDALLRLLGSGPEGMAAMADADYLGLLDAHLPEWHRVRGRRQRNPLHSYDLDTHGLQAVANLVDLGRGSLDPRHAEIYAGLEARDTLLLATWLHDVGKAWAGDHSVAGEAVVREWIEHMGFADRVADHAGRLVRHHLLLPDAATQRDIDDPEEVIDVAVTLGDVERLDGLYLLSLADARATGPAAWSAWKDLLITQLYQRARQVLVAGEDAVRRGPAPEAVVTAAAERSGIDPESVAATVAGLPRRYLRNADADQLAAHVRLLSPPPADGELRCATRPGPVEGTVVLTVVAPDRRGLFADCAGVLAGHGAQVLEARAFTGSGGIALDWFTCATRPELDWDRVQHDLGAVAAGTADAARMVARRESRRDAQPPVLAEPLEVSVHVEAGADVTRVEVHGPDAPGVLYRLARVLADAGVDLVGAQVATLGPEVRDSFFCAGPLPDQDELVARLTAAAGHA